MPVRRKAPKLALALLAAAALLTSCARESAEAEPEPDRKDEGEREAGRETGSSSDDRKCHQRMERFAKRMAPLARRGAGAVPAEIRPIESKKGSPIRTYGPQIVVEKSGALSFDYQPVEDLSELEERLAMELERMRLSERRRPIYLWADARTPAARAVRIAAAAPDELEVRLALAGPKPEPTAYETELLKKPRIEKVHAKLQGAGASQKAVLVAEEMEGAIGLCAPLIKVFGAVAGVGAGEKAKHIAREAPRAVEKCRCEVGDLDMLEFLLLASMGAFDRPARWVPVSEARRVLR